MPRIGGSQLAFFVGLITAIILVVLDKAGKLRNPTVLIGLLCIAAALTLPMATGNSWVYKASPGMPRVARILLGISLVGVFYSLLLIWISTPNKGEKPNGAIENLSRRISILEQLQGQASTKQVALETKYPTAYFLFASNKHTIYIPSPKKAEKTPRIFALDWETSEIMYVDGSFVNILLKSFHYYPNEIQVNNLDIVLERRIGTIADGIYFNNIGMFVELLDDKDDGIIYVIGFKQVKLIPKKREPNPEVAAFIKKLGKPIMSGIDTNIQKHIVINDLAISSGWTTIKD
jgi:hypothetical protein